MQGMGESPPTKKHFLTEEDSSPHQIFISPPTTKEQIITQ